MNELTHMSLFSGIGQVEVIQAIITMDTQTGCAENVTPVQWTTRLKEG